MSALQIYSYDLVPYGVIVFANIKKMSNTNTVYNKIIANLHDAILQEYANNAQVLRASILQNVLQDNIDELNHIKVQFTGDSTYINEFGDIDTRNNITAENKLILPYITKGSYNNMDFFDMPFKVLVKHTNADSWTELIKNNADYES
jgi:glucose dehydrogenase